jgi:hypothetical protein
MGHCVAPLLVRTAWWRHCLCLTENDYTTALKLPTLTWTRNA